MSKTIEIPRSGRRLTFIVEQSDRGNRLDRIITRLVPEYSRSFFQRLIKEGRVSVDGNRACAGDLPSPGSRIDLVVPEDEPQTIGPEDIPVPIVFEDEYLVVIDKPAGLSVHPGAGRISGTLVSALLFRGMRLSEKAGDDRPGIVHRLDKDTSGLLVVAKDDRAYDGLKAQFMNHAVLRSYRGVCWGRIGEDRGVIETLISRHRRDRTRMTTRTDAGRQAITEFYVLERFSSMTFLRFRLRTGRTHQIRVHLASRGHPIVGDRTYGSMRAAKQLNNPLLLDAVKALHRQALHASTLGFVHPITNEPLSFESGLPPDITRLVEVLRNEG